MVMEELKKLKLFANCSDEALERLLSQPCRRQQYASGKLILRAGDPCRSLMILVEGRADARMMGEEGREVLSNRSNFLSGKMRSFAVNGLRNRVVEYLDEHGSITSVAAVAQELGATRPSLSRVLSEMLSEGVIVKDGKGYGKA